MQLSACPCPFYLLFPIVLNSAEYAVDAVRSTYYDLVLRRSVKCKREKKKKKKSVEEQKQR